MMGRMRDREDILDLGAWCILRMTATSTLDVYNSLKKAGFNVWTPIEERMKGESEKQVAMLPTYVFAQADRVAELAAIAMLPANRHPDFRVFQHLNGFPLVADSELDALRDIEGHHREIAKRAKRKGMKAPTFERGTPVRMQEGGFVGIPGVVVGTQGSYTLVDFENFPQPVKIASLLLADHMPREEADERRALRHRNAAKYMGDDAMLENRFRKSA